MNDKPFYKTKLDEELDSKRKLFTVSLNQQEQAWLEEIKEDLNIKSDGKALKTAAFIGLNVLHGMFGRKFLQYLFKKDRQKLSDFKDY